MGPPNKPPNANGAGFMAAYLAKAIFGAKLILRLRVFFNLAPPFNPVGAG